MAQSGPVAYWMSRDQRVQDNWALLYAQKLALENKRTLIVVFCLSPSFLGATTRQYEFMLQGLEEIEAGLSLLNIPFFVLLNEASAVLPELIRKESVSAVITDFSPLRIGRKWREDVANNIPVPLYEVDAHNIIPAWVVSPKQEFGAYTIRPKIYKQLPDFIDEFPEVEKHAYPWKDTVASIDWNDIRSKLAVDTSVPEVKWCTPGEKAATEAWNDFLENKIERYGSDRNFPDKDGQSNLSPYLHFGQLSAQRLVLDINQRLFSEHGKSLRDVMHKNSNGSATTQDSMAAFLEELVVRRELSDNFCLYNAEYDSVKGFPNWATVSIDAHRKDPREFIYTRDELEFSKTHDDLWNAAQKEMVVKGKMHGYMRMYWAKKILEWTESPEQAMEYAIYLNDRYELDGRDPNGYAGIAWSIGGVHDRAWFDRPVFGKIRFMSYNGAKSKFDIASYISSVNALDK